MTAPEDLARRVAALGASSLLPPGRVVTRSSDEVVLRDAIDLGGGLALAVLAHGSGLLAAPLVIGDGELVRRAEPGDGVFERLLHRLAVGGSVGRFSFVATEVVPEVSGERVIDVDQSNESIVVGERVVVKLFPRLSLASRSLPDLPAHLTAVGFASIPTPFGAMIWNGDEGHATVATAVAYLPEARDGWDWYLSRLLGWLDDEADDASAFEPAGMLGAMAAEMHAALATASDVVPAPIDIAGESVAVGWRQAAHAVADDALALTEGDEGLRLASRERAIRAELEGLGEAAGSIVMQVHGDFHVGQVLEWRNGYAITDFDGNPMASPGERGEPDTPVRDVAAFVRSIDHLGRIASRRRPAREEAITAWIRSSRASFLEAYLKGLETRGERRLFDARLLRPLEIAQECHEYVYAARFLPRWLYVPDLAMRSLIAKGD